MLDRITVVLVETRRAGNIGSVARAMKNMGLSSLKLVAPREPVNDECRMMAAGALDIVERARVFPTLDAALAEEQWIVGTTSHRARTSERRLHTARELGPLALRQAETQRVALLFGPERSGLDDDALSRCQCLASIPASQRHPVLNLAQAAMVVCYEIFTAQAAPSEGAPALATYQQREEMFRHMREVLSRIGFFRSDNQAHMMKALRRLFGRSLTPRDIRIVRGILSQVQWFAEQGRKLPEEKVRRT